MHNSICPIERRRMRPFDWQDRSQHLVQIPSEGRIDCGDVINGPIQQIARPTLNFDFLVKHQIEDWIVTSTFLFPTHAPDWGSTLEWYDIRPYECLLVSFANLDSAFMTAISGEKVTLMPPDWWRGFEEVEYRQHPVFPSIETSKTGLIRVNGELRDIGRKCQIPVPSTGGLTLRTVGELVVETWGEGVAYVSTN